MKEFEFLPVPLRLKEIKLSLTVLPAATLFKRLARYGNAEFSPRHSDNYLAIRLQ